LTAKDRVDIINAMKKTETKDIGRFAALLSIIEIGLGSFLHSFKAPFTGQLLSLNQVFILTRSAIVIENKNAPAMISNTAALLKSLSPAGKKITPMLAISAQGNLFSIGLYFLGNNIFGHLLGSFFLCLWAYIQPLAIYLILFGEDLLFMGQYFLKKLNKVFPVTEEEVLWYIAMLILFKIFISFSVVLSAHFLSDKHLSLYESWAKNQKIKKQTVSQSPLKGALKDLLNPLFIISILMMTFFFVYARTSTGQIIWQLMRPIAGGFILFYILRVFPIETFSIKLKDGKYKDILIEAIKILKE
jgi:hypothetical protein